MRIACSALPSNLASLYFVSLGLSLSAVHGAAMATNGTVVGWGFDSTGPLAVPSNLSNVVAVAAGFMHGIAAKDDGTVIAWGYNGYGETNVPAGLSNVMAVAAGLNFSLALRSDGTVVGWGRNSDGEISIPPGLKDVVAISAGQDHSLALKKDGSMVAWGKKGSGQANVPLEITDAVAIAAGGWHSVAVRKDGRVVAWGENYYGQSRPPDDLAGVRMVAAGETHTLALRADGTVVGWGSNLAGETEVPGDLRAITAISAGHLFSVALGSDGTVRAWGFNGSGTISVPPALANVVAVSANSEHCLALVNNPPLPPRIIIQPLSQVAAVDCTASFYALAAGTGPLIYQWRKDGIELPGATNMSLVIESVQPSAAGEYDVVATNPYGPGVSTAAALTIVPMPTKPRLLVTNRGDRGPGSLRQAIVEANAVCGGDIVFSNVTGVMKLVSALPAIAGNTTLVGPGTNLLTISANHLSRVLEFGIGSTGVVSGLTLTDGVLANENGAGILNEGSLTISNCVLTGNRTAGGFGGAVYSSGSLTILHSQFTANSAIGGSGSPGGGYLTNVLGIGGPGGGGAGLGGGLFTTGGSVQIIDSAFLSNSVAGGIPASGRGSPPPPLAGGGGGGVNGGAGGAAGIPRANWLSPGGPGGDGGFGGGGGGGGFPGGKAGDGGFGGGGGGGPTLSFSDGGKGGYGGGDGTGGGNTGGGAWTGAGGGGAGFGGGIFVKSGSVSLVRCRFDANRAAAADAERSDGGSGGGSGFGGGLFLLDGEASLVDCIFWSNETRGGNGDGIHFGSAGAPGGGAGVFAVAGDLTIVSSTFAGNIANGGNGGGGTRGGGSGGGGIGGALSVDGATVSIINSTLSGNKTFGGNAGGGSPLSGGPGQGGSGFGGGVYLRTGSVSMVNCTVFNNACVGGLGVTYTLPPVTPFHGSGIGGGLYSGNGSLTVLNTIVAGNAGMTNIGTNRVIIQSDASGALLSHGHNLLGSTNGMSGLLRSDLYGVPPELGSLQDNGGPTLTHALFSSSLAVNGAETAGAPRTDQRGQSRPQGPLVDIGAFELKGATNLSPPILLGQPQGQTAAAGANAVLIAGIWSAIPLEVQWFKDGVPVRGATNLELVLTDVQFIDAGSYSASATNSAGVIETAPAALAVVPPVIPPEFQWARAIGGTNDDSGEAIAADGAGNCYIAGYYAWNISLDSTNFVSAGGSDALIANYDAHGRLQWATSAGGPDSDAANAIYVDSLTNIWVAGSFGSTAAFGNISLTATGLGDAFLAQLGAHGQVSKVFQYGGPETEGGFGVAVDPLGNVYLGGRKGNSPNFVACYDPGGTLRWSQDLGRGGTVWSVAPFAAGGCVVAGNFTDLFAIGAFQLGAHAPWGDAFVVALREDGSLRWSRQFWNTNKDLVPVLALASDSSNNTYIAQLAPRLNVGFYLSYDSIIGKYDNSGILLWERHIFSPGFGWTTVKTTGIAADNRGNCYVAGPFDPAADFGTTNLVGPGIFVARYGPAGRLEWVVSNGSYNGGWPVHVAADNHGGCYLLGDFQTKSITFGDTTLTNRRSPVGLSDVFLVKLTPRPLLRVRRNFETATNPQPVFSLVGEVSEKYEIEVSGDLKTWNTMLTLTNTLGLEYFNDPAAGASSQRFYRAVVAP